MSREIICPGCKMVIPIDTSPPHRDEAAPGEEAEAFETCRTVETVVPRTVCLDDLDADDPDRRAMSDAISGGFPPPGSGSGEIEGLTAAAHDPFLASLASGGSIAETGPAHDVATGGGVASLGIDSAPAASGATRPQQEAWPEPIGPNDSAQPTAARHHGPPLSQVLLASYASAVTLGLVWLLWTGWGRDSSGRQEMPLPLDSQRLSLEKRDGSEYIRRLPEIPATRRTTLNRPVRVGDLEVTPLAVELAPVRLVGLEGKRKTAEGTPALHLRLKLRNVSEGTTFAPLDPSFVREPDQGTPESLVVAGDRPIWPFPLATQSEWSVVGQGFEPLAPGEERVVVVASESGAEAKLAGVMTWRLRLRTSEGQTEILGVEFARSDVARAKGSIRGDGRANRR